LNTGRKYIVNCALKFIVVFPGWIGSFDTQYIFNEWDFLFILYTCISYLHKTCMFVCIIARCCISWSGGGPGGSMS